VLDSGRDLDAAERWVDDWQSSIEERAAQAQTLAGRIAGLSATARSDDRLVEVTVASSGAIDRLHLDERIRSQSAARTAEQILTTVRAAQARLAHLATEATAETIGLDTETGRAIANSFAARFGETARGVADAR
jgi:hypothetical protein